MEIACKTLGVSQTDSLDKIRKRYKELARKLHPDKGGDEDVFQLIQQSYCVILKEFKNKQEDRQHHELKSDYLHQSENYKPSSESYMNISEKDMFNQVFEQHRTPSVMDSGYGDIMTKSSGIREGINIDNTMKKFTIDNFNKKFDEIPTSKKSKHLVKKEVVEPYHAPKTLTFTTLGQSNISDFSGNNDNIRNLQYTDYQKAHTTSKLIDPKQLKLKKEGVVSMKEAEKKRNNMRMTFTPKEKERYEKHLDKEKDNEEKRLKNLESYDNYAASNFEKAKAIIQQYRELHKLT